MHLERLKTSVREHRFLTSEQGCQAGGGSMLVSRGIRECGMTVGRVYEYCMCAAITQLVNMGPIGCVRGLGTRQGCRAGKGAVLVLRVCTNMHVLVNLESVVCMLH